MKIPGSIQRVVPNTLSYSCDFSSRSDDSNLRSAFADSEYEEDSVGSARSMEFDLRDEKEEIYEGNPVILDVLNTKSETVMSLESAPHVPCDTRQCSPIPTPSQESTVMIDSERVSELVDNLIGSPARMPRLVTTKKRMNTSQPITGNSSRITTASSSPIATAREIKVFPVARTPPKKTPLPDKSKQVPRARSQVVPRLSNVSMKAGKMSPIAPQLQESFVPFGEYRSSRTHKAEKVRTELLSFKRATDWRCPDSWIPNHRCDDFCFESLQCSFSKNLN